VGNRFARSVLSVLSVLSTTSVSPLGAQAIHVSGQVLKADSSAVGGVRVVLHRVGRTRQGPIDSTRSDRQGRFQFSYRPDTAAFYLASGRYAGIEYFSSPLPTNPERRDTSVRLMVYDTSSAAPIELEARHLVLTRPGEEGSRGLLDLIILRNPGRLTRVAPDSLQGTWSLLLPHGSSGLQVRESDISAEALKRTGDTLTISAALAPGEKQLTLEYQVPLAQQSIELRLQRAGFPLNVMVEEPGVKVEGPGLAPADSQVIQNRSFRRWSGTVTRAGVLRLTLPGNHATPRWLLVTLVGGLGLALFAGGLYALRSKPHLRQAE
jgi:hypothetical protein